MENAAPLLCHPPFGGRPQLKHVGLGVHGEARKQSYRLDLWALHAYPYEAEVELQGRREQIHPGMVGLTPPRVEVVYFYQETVQHRYAHFALAEGVEGRVAVPMLLGDKALYTRVWTGLGVMQERGRGQTLRAEVLLWELLWSIADEVAEVEAVEVMHPALAAAVSVIDEELALVPGVAELAHRVGVSQNHLIRLFQKKFGVPVATYVRRQRVAQAEYLLKHTNLPQKQIAASVGIANLQVFNKTLRRVAGASPKALRGEGRKQGGK
jgi:AraC-like DNA-binding protein